MNLLEETPYKSSGGVTEGGDWTIKDTPAKGRVRARHQSIDMPVTVITAS